MIKCYKVDYRDVFDDHLVFRTKYFSRAFDRMLCWFVIDWSVYRGYIEDGVFFSERLVARSATYSGV